MIANEKQTLTLAGKNCWFYGKNSASYHLIQAVDDHDLEVLDQEVREIEELAETDDFCLLAFQVENWNRDLSPWEVPAVFGKEPFGNGAAQTLSFIEKVILPFLECDIPVPQGKRNFLGGYSLSGLFALWCAYQSEYFHGIAAVSLSVWFPGWLEYAAAHHCHAASVYLSLGDKEEKTRNKTMAQVGTAIRRQYELLKDSHLTGTILEWNPGNHFQEPELRMAKGFSWLIKAQKNKNRTERFTFRAIRQEEIAQAAEIEQICFPPNEACTPKSMKERIEKAPEQFLVAIDNETGKIAGFLNGLATNESAFRDDFFTDASLHESEGQNILLLGLDVLPEYRRQGLASELMRRYLENEKKKGRRLILLTCLAAKVEMYQKMGFRDLGISGSVWGGEEWHEMAYDL